MSKEEAKHERSFAKRLWYDALRVISRLAGVCLFRIRVYGRENWPTEGGGLVCPNHQSFLDPLLVGLTCDRRLNFLARRTLFKFLPFRMLIESLDTIPIDRDGSGLAGLKETLKRLKRGELVLIFPEGTRTSDGELQPLKGGFIPMARRGGVPIIPVAIDGAFDAWPRSAKFPRRSVIHIRIAPPISTEMLNSLSDDELLAELDRRLAEAFAAIRETRALA
ncbi:1-acyl-sn-glycerol-3-phosphate acyltransferase [Blastopirellula sp. JC732]|uniref:1-acyl-sn-glycerol-3-phosphate acyltransferase n=1 Tax=Blastopirellula sediminis TaxID=2894196 RepID=A0A9X1SGV9_9BACT|nr:lysophospholipid acyltransferase family protein [Blastopirellula sediminis]MCC9607596.1 1-acyl-sn-glycerol-3-phosphate acyltransferase [Blastopirellula sediminis]MCC9629111.1 1-acyl-sn-glycerol-3-phosphate acyltransferase [Blastopirellula sediminis]